MEQKSSAAVSLGVSTGASPRGRVAAYFRDRCDRGRNRAARAGRSGSPARGNIACVLRIVSHRNSQGPFRLGQEPPRAVWHAHFFLPLTRFQILLLAGNPPLERQKLREGGGR